MSSDNMTKYNNCFISYSSTDESFALKISESLRSEGVRYWFAPKDMRAGRKIHEQIRTAIGEHERLIIILSESSMNSNWVKTELAEARKREIEEGKQILFPITLTKFNEIRKWELFDADIGKDTAREIREYLILDFSDWQNDESYQREFARLLDGLRAE